MFLAYLMSYWGVAVVASASVSRVSSALRFALKSLHVELHYRWETLFKLQPAIFPLSQHVIRFHELPADTTQRFLQ